VLALDDLHAADDASLQLLATVAKSAADAALLVLGTFRAAEVASSPARQRLLASVAARGRELRLEGLDADGVATLLERAGLSSPALVRRVHATTDGNPFFVSEAARLLSSGRHGAAVPLPEEVHALIRRRLEPLDAHLRRVLSRAAVLGREFDIAALVAVAETPPHALLDRLAEASAFGVVEQVGLGRWSFAHALLRETLYDGLVHDERADAHRRAGEAIEALHAKDLDEHLTALAHHFTAAGDAGRAVDYGARAGAQAMAMLAYEEAASFFRRALEMLDRSAVADDRRRFELLMGEGDALWNAGEWTTARDVHRRALRMARAMGSPELFARGVVGYAGTDIRADLIPLIQEALEGLPNQDSALRARLLMQLARAHEYDHHAYDARILELSDEALAMARRLDDPPTLLSLLWRWLLANVPNNDLHKERLARSKELLALSLDSGLSVRISEARGIFIGNLLACADMAAAWRELDLAERDARTPLAKWGFATARTEMVLLQGRLDEAERLADETVHKWSEDVPFLHAEHLGQRLVVRLHQGRFEELLDELDRAIAAAEPITGPFPRGWLALYRAESGQLDAARTELDDLIAWGPFARSGAPMGALLAATAWALDDETHAEGLYASLCPYRERDVWVPNYLSYGAYDRYLGQLASLLRRFEEAEERFLAAHRLHERMGARAWDVHTLIDHARMLLKRSHPGDRAQARALLERAVQRARALGMDVQASRAAALLCDIAGAERAVLREEGDGWFFAFADNAVRVHDSKGLQYLAELLRHPGVALTASQLVGVEDPERARLAATRALKGALDRLADAHPVLGGHLRATVRVGAVSSYQPDPRAPIRWEG